MEKRGASGVHAVVSSVSPSRTDDLWFWTPVSCEPGEAVIEPYSAKASLLPTLLLRGRLIPQEIHLSPEKIMIRTWGILWLSHMDEDIPWEKIAGYHYHSGWFWDGIEIQTRGQQANSITCLPKACSQKIKEILEQMKE